eukprot:scaffold5828_cov168-Amphora_coffeaeformis.AAC.28
MKSTGAPVISALLLVAVALPGFQSFLVEPTRSRPSVFQPSSVLYQSSPNDGEDSPPPPKLVDTDVFKAAVDTLKAELAKQQDAPPMENDDHPDTFYAIGKVMVNLNIESGNPGMDLAESSGGLVLVSGVTGQALEAGIQTGDTIVGVGVKSADAFQETHSYCLEDTARVLMGAMKMALENESSVIELELNRLVKMRYA